MELTASKFRTKDLAYIAVSVALTAICSWISIPTAVPFTLQTMAEECRAETILLDGNTGDSV